MTTTAGSRPGLLMLGAAACAAAGFLLALAFVKGPPSGSNVTSAALESQVTRLADSMGALAGSLDQASKRLEGALARLEPALAVGLERRALSRQEPLPVHAQAALGGGHGQGDDQSWVSALSGSISRALVERGLTPYDQGVQVHVTEAGDALSKADQEFYKAFGQLTDQVNLLHMSAEEYNSRLRALQETQQAERDAALVKLKSALDALPK